MKTPVLPTTLPITAIIPIYDCPYTDFRKCLDSIANQIQKPECVIIVDDGNQDSELQKIVTSFTESVKRDIEVKFISLEHNLGISVARNIALDKIKTKWVCFIDADDWILCNYFQKLYDEVANDENIDIIACSCYAFNGVSFSRNHFFKENMTLEKDGLREFERALIDPTYLQDGTPIDSAIGVPWGKLYRYSCIKELRFNPEIKRMEDNLFNYEILYKCSNLCIRYINEPLYVYRTAHITRYNQEYEEDVDFWFLFINERKRIMGQIKDLYLEKIFYEEVIRILMITLRKKYFHKFAKSNNSELRDRISEPIVKEALRRTCENTPIYCNVMNKLLLHGNFRMARFVNWLRGR